MIPTLNAVAWSDMGWGEKDIYTLNRGPTAMKQVAEAFC
jgi:hypothetical protein